MALMLNQLGLARLSTQLIEEVSKRTSTDKLTGLWNRQYFNERFREECERLVRSRETGSVAIIGLKAGESKDFPTTLAAGDHAGKEAQVSVTVKSVKERELPAVDDDFAQHR